MAGRTEIAQSTRRPAASVASELADARKKATLSWIEAGAPYGIFTTDTELNIRSWNVWLVKRTGLSADEVVGRPLADVFSASSPSELETPFRSALGSGTSPDAAPSPPCRISPSLVVRSHASTPMLQTAHVAPLWFGQQTIGTIATIEDHWLEEHAETLETKIAERTAHLYEIIAQLESFSYTIAHDLRAPIRSLKVFTEILLKDYAASMPETGQTLLRRLLRASNRLDALTRDLLQFSRIVRQDVKLEPVDIAELVHEIVAVTPPLQEGALIMVPSLGVVRAQRTLLQQCVSNLLDNALKFVAPEIAPRIIVSAELRGPEATTDHPARDATFNAFLPSPALDIPTVPASLQASSEDSPRIRIWIEDNGIGIAPAMHEKIFGIFERAGGVDHVEGTGIGLAIVARAMHQMGGTCGVESELGHGSRFWLELPAAS
jgi:signal transduction histidine kinase